jgi:uncharacterized protein
MLPPLRVKPRREDLSAGESLCDHCTAKCCRYFALPLDTPEARKDFDALRWFLLHQRTSIFVDDATWYLLVHTECRHLQPDQRCGIYETRPQICRDYSTKKCEYEDEWTYDQYFETPEQLEEYVEARYPRRGKQLRTPKPGLPLLRTLPR